MLQFVEPQPVRDPVGVGYDQRPAVDAARLCCACRSTLDLIMVYASFDLIAARGNSAVASRSHASEGRVTTTSG
jgi:hypothetical protein